MIFEKLFTMLCHFQKCLYLNIYCQKHFVRHVVTVLGIETSHDETGIGIVNSQGKILANVCRSQLIDHRDFGGVLMNVAQKLHKKHVDDLTHQALKIANMSAKDLTAVAVTNRPGLALALDIGLKYAKPLSLKYKLPMIPIHHMEAHALIAKLTNKELVFPYLILLISGGHCQLGIVNNVTEYILFGESQDDAPGDVLDKGARRLKLKLLDEKYSTMNGGAALEEVAKSGNPQAYFNHYAPFSRHNLYAKDCMFLFAAYYGQLNKLVWKLENEIQLEPDQVLPQITDLAASYQHAITMQIVRKLQRGIRFVQRKEYFKNRRPHLVVSGGVACNNYIINAISNLCQMENIELIVPTPRHLCSDNGVMIAWNGVLKMQDINKHLICRTEKEINAVNYEAKVPLGVNISEEVAKENIEWERLSFKQLINLEKSQISL